MSHIFELCLASRIKNFQFNFFLLKRDAYLVQVKHCWYILAWKFISSVADNHTRFSNIAISDHS